MASPLRIGLTMRVVDAPGYHEPRDAIAQAWAAFLASVFPPGSWLPLPNAGPAEVQAACEHWGVNRLILSGGEDIGTSPTRDATEAGLLAWAAQRRIPVLGICRGMQQLAVHAGGRLKRVEGHVRVRHAVSGEIAQEVNSFHGWGLDGCPPGYRVQAVAPDGEIEAIAHAQLPWAGWMWHPEREADSWASDRNHLKELFR